MAQESMSGRPSGVASPEPDEAGAGAGGGDEQADGDAARRSTVAAGTEKTLLTYTDEQLAAVSRQAIEEKHALIEQKLRAITPNLQAVDEYRKLVRSLSTRLVSLCTIYCTAILSY